MKGRGILPVLCLTFLITACEDEVKTEKKVVAKSAMQRVDFPTNEQQDFVSELKKHRHGVAAENPSKNAVKQTASQTGHTENDPSAKTSAAEIDKQVQKPSSQFTAANRSSQTAVSHAPVTNPRFIVDANLIAQYPQLPRGSEVTRLAMMLNHAGIHVSKMTLARQVKKDPTPYKVKDGKTYFGNPYTGFVGDMYDLKNPGYGVYHGPIFDLAKRYLGGRAVDLTGNGFAVVEAQIKKSKPVWVIVTSWFRAVPESEWETWQTPAEKIRMTYHEPAVLVAGFDTDNVYFNAPLAAVKNRKVPRTQFIAGWNPFGRQAISCR